MKEIKVSKMLQIYSVEDWNIARKLIGTCGYFSDISDDFIESLKTERPSCLEALISSSSEDECIFVDEADNNYKYFAILVDN